MLATIATPLMGLVDTAILGRLGDPAMIAAAGVGATIFTLLYWCFSFLRYTTSALVGQAIGREDAAEVLLAGLRPMIAALAGGIGFWLLQQPIGRIALSILAPPESVSSLAAQYFQVRIWSAPFTLLGYAQFAWLLGQGRARMVMLLQIGLNTLNGGLAYVFVIAWHQGITGAAWATVTSEACTCVVTTAFMLRLAPLARWHGVAGGIWQRAAWRRLFSANVDITVRTLLLTGSFALFTERSAHSGLMDLAANQLLMQAFLFIATLLDGFATAAEIHGARAIGAGSRSLLVQIVRRTAVLSLGWSILLAAVLLAVRTPYLAIMTSSVPLQQTAAHYWVWVALLPLVCIWAFLWDGVFFGAMRTHILRNTMLASVGLYVPALFSFTAIWGNHGTWGALVILMAARSLFLSLAWPGLKNAVATTERREHRVSDLP